MPIDPEDLIAQTQGIAHCQLTLLDGVAASLRTYLTAATETDDALLLSCKLRKLTTLLLAWVHFLVPCQACACAEMAEREDSDG